VVTAVTGIRLPLVIFLVLLAILAVVLSNRVPSSSDGGADGDGYMGTYGGNPAVYQRIAADTDCASLQAQFDQAAANHDRDSDAGDLEAMKWSTGYMVAADDRMRGLGCY
jgi:hypothetical protein